MASESQFPELKSVLFQRYVGQVIANWRFSQTHSLKNILPWSLAFAHRPFFISTPFSPHVHCAFWYVVAIMASNMFTSSCVQALAVSPSPWVYT